MKNWKSARHYPLILIVSCIIIPVFPFKSRGAELRAPSEVIEEFHRALLESMQQSDRLCFAGRYEFLKPIIINTFDLTFMTQKSVGRYWDTLREEDRLLLQSKYTSWSVSKYANSFSGYSGERFITLSAAETGDGTAEVLSRLHVPDEDEYEFFYKLRLENRQWRVVDMQVDGVSQLALARAQYLPVIKHKGFADLISKLQSKTDALAAEEDCVRAPAGAPPAPDETEHSRQPAPSGKSAAGEAPGEISGAAASAGSAAAEGAKPHAAADLTQSRPLAPASPLVPPAHGREPAMRIEPHRAGALSADNESGTANRHDDDQIMSGSSSANTTAEDNDIDFDPFDNGEWDDLEKKKTVADPLELWNRGVFTFNDKFYFWAFKPVATGYNRVVPENARVAMRNFFDNLATPVRVVNTLLQGDVKGAGIELARFGLNSTIGVLGFGDAANKYYHLQSRDEDFGQTLGTYGIGNGLYVVWPFLGPSSLRDTAGMAADGLLNPLGFFFGSKVLLSARAYDFLNENSFRVNDYESFKRNALEPYIALQSAYIQNRRSKIDQQH